MCRVEQGLPAFSRPLAPKTHPGTLKRRREALVDLYDRGLIQSVKKNSVRFGPRLTRTGKRLLNWVREGGEYGSAPYDPANYRVQAAAVSAIRQRLKRGELIESRYD